MKDKRPVYLSVNPFKFNFPLAALASIVHRMTGAFLVIGVGYFLYLLDLSLSSPAGFEKAQDLLAQPFHKLTLFAFLSAITYHLILGIKHLLLDFHIADSLEGSKTATIISLAVFVVAEIGWILWMWT